MLYVAMTCMGLRRRLRARTLVAAVVTTVSMAGMASACGASQPDASWSSANGDLSNRRALDATVLDARTIPRLRVRWRFRLKSHGSSFGAITANPIISGKTVYIQDATSSEYALTLETGALR
ncbi:MAG TPA: hypothetical protein VGH82_13670 [Gaiellaceae bacterium]|jgi:hypothetical protein